MFEKDKEKIRSKDIQQEFILALYNLYTFLEACADMKLNPAVVAVFMNENAEFESEVRKAQQFQVDCMVDKLEKINEYEDNAVMAGVISKNIQWLAGRRNRKLYGEKLDVNHTVNINIAQAIEEAKQRTLNYGSANHLIVNDLHTDNISVPKSLSYAEEEEDIDPLS